jgi:TPR repeat protein
MALAGTFDVAQFAQLGVRSIYPDAKEARRWYERAQQLGANEAEERLRRITAAEPKIAEVRTMKVRVHPAPVFDHFDAPTQHVTGSVAPRAVIQSLPGVEPPPPPVAAKFAPPPSAAHQPNELIARASRLLKSGDVAGAREMLAEAEDGTQGLIAFALAETYDPNMLAAWGTQGVAADVARAQTLYRKAMSLGISAARGRLEALPPVLLIPPTPIHRREKIGPAAPRG